MPQLCHCRFRHRRKSFRHCRREVCLINDVELRIRVLRERKGWSQAELARRAGPHNSVVNRAERGEIDITTGTLEKLATALGVHPRRLIG